jgi:hypothetical protein
MRLTVQMHKGLLAVLLITALWSRAPPVRRERQQPQNKISPLETPVATFHGALKSVNKKEIVLEVAGGQSVAFHISHKTKFLKDSKPIKPAAIPPNAPLTIDGKRDLLGNVDAVTVTVDSPGHAPDHP